MLLMKDIIDDKNPLVRKVSAPVELPLSKEDEKLLLDMHQFVVNSQDDEIAEKYDLRPAVGIAAVQVGVLKRMCAIHVVDYDNDGNVKKTHSYALANPKIVSYTEKKAYLENGEGCLSVNREVEGHVKRYARITVEGYDLEGNKSIPFVTRIPST